MAGEGTWSDDLPLLLTRNGRTCQTYWTFSYSPLYDDAGGIVGFMNVVNETTRNVENREALARANAILALEYERTSIALERQREAERLQRVLQRELSHRMKNTLAMVQAVVSQSLRHATSPADVATIASARIQALGRAQDMLTDASWEVADIRPVVEASIAPHADRPDRFVLDGPDARLTAQQSMGIALAIHELATNAVKYGALSCDEGRVYITWRTEPDHGFRFEWREGGGPPVVPPTRRGFGSRLIERVVPGYFAGEARIDFQPAGIRFAFEGRLDLER
jgi:two-component sensor histidine kinase